MSQEAIILPVYLIHWNAPEWLASSVRSVLGSQGISVRLIIIDNGQKHGSPVREVIPNDVEIIRAEANRGFTGGANLALRDWASRFPTLSVALIGSHDLHVHPETLRALVEAARTHPEFGIVGPSLRAPFESSGGRWGKTGAYQVPLIGGEGLIERDWVSGTCMLLRRQCIDQLGGFDERFKSYCEDVDLGLRARAHGWKVGVFLEAQAWGLGSRRRAAWTLIEANGVLLAAKHLGPGGAAASLWRLCVWAGRALGGSLALWRSGARRRMSIEFFWRHVRALAYVARSWRVIVALLVDGRARGHSKAWPTRLEHGAPPSKLLLKGTGHHSGAPVVSVVIPTRNRLALLQEAVESVRSQTYQAWELIVVDDASEDGTWEWLTAQRDPMMQVMRLERHSERSAARNRGLSIARGEFVLFLDDDDRLLPKALARLVRGLRRWPTAVAAVGARIVFDDQGSRRRVPHPRLHLTRIVWPDVLAGWVAGHGQWLFRTARLRESAGWKEDLLAAEDHELWLRLGRLGPSLFLPALVLENRKHPAQWGPRDVAMMEDEFRRSFAEKLVGRDAHLAARILKARVLSKVAAEAYALGDYRRAVAYYIGATSTSPGLLTSPLTGPGLAGSLFKALIGLVLRRRGVRVAKRLKALGWQMLRQDTVATHDGERLRGSARR